MNTSAEITGLIHSINNIRQQFQETFDQVLKCTKSNSTLGKLYQVFMMLKDTRKDLIHSEMFNEFLEEIDLIAKENGISREDFYRKFLAQLSSPNFNENNNARNLNSYRKKSFSTEYKNDLSRLEEYFIKQCNKFEENSNEMTCPTFVRCISEKIQDINHFDLRLQLNGLFYQTHSLLVHQGVSIPTSLTIDFQGFLLSLQLIARTFHFNLKILLKHFIDHKKTPVVLQ